MKFTAIVLVQILLAVACFAAAGQAAPLPAPGPTPVGLSFPLPGPPQFSPAAAVPGFRPFDSPRPDDASFDWRRVAYRISYLGTILLTADRVVKSVNSMLDRMEYTASDGTCFRFSMEPRPRGFEVAVKMTHPLHF